MMFGNEVKLHLSTSGHYCLDISPNIGKIDALSDSLEAVFVLEDNLSDSDKVKKIQKLHKQFSHASKEDLKRLIKNAGTQDPNLMKIIAEVVETCNVCKKYKKPAPRPVVGLSRAEDFNL